MGWDGMGWEGSSLTANQGPFFGRGGWGGLCREHRGLNIENVILVVVVVGHEMVITEQLEQERILVNLTLHDRLLTP